MADPQLVAVVRGLAATDDGLIKLTERLEQAEASLEENVRGWQACRRKYTDVRKRAERAAEALQAIKPLVDPDQEPHDADNRKQILAMRDQATQAWVIAAEALLALRQEAEIGKPRSSGPPYNAQRIPM